MGDLRARSLELATKALVSSLVDYEDPPRAKAGIQLLTTFISKQLLDVKDLPSAFTSLRPGIHVHEGFLGAQDLLEVLFRWLGKGDFGSTIASSVSTVLERLDYHDAELGGNVGNAREVQPWRTPLESSYRQGGINMDDLRAHIFPMLFRRRPEDFSTYLHWYGIEVGRDYSTKIPSFDSYAEMLYAALHTGKAIGLLTETDDRTVTCVDHVVGVPISIIGSLMTSSDRSARLAGLSVLLVSPIPSKPLSVSALALVKKAFGVYLADVDADFRSEVFGAFQRLVDRLRSVTAVLSRANALSTTIEMAQITLQKHQDLLKWLLRFLTQELRPTASYQRHICALRCLSMLARSGLDHGVPAREWSKSAQGQIKWPFEISVMSPELRRLLVDLLMDPFDDVRQSSFSLLNLYSSLGVHGETSAPSKLEVLPSSACAVAPDFYLQALDRAEATMHLTGRADHADGVAYLYSLYYQACIAEGRTEPAWQYAEQTVLEEKLLKKLELFVGTAQRSLSEAVAGLPLHGLLTSLRYVLAQRHLHVHDHSHDQMPDTIYSWLRQIWDVVKPVLCDDAPEGYLPEESEACANDTKKTLSYCWRALKESSLLLGTLVSLDPSPSSDEAANLTKYSSLCFTQLAELRHRGAFSTVAQTWATCCTRAKDASHQGQPQLEIWYEDIVSKLRTNVTINTRRSAGFPSLLCGVLVADRSGKLVAQAVTDLESIARQKVDARSAEEGSLAQVHAMNCFKDILKNSKLGERSEPFLANALQLSADALRSEAWAIRNCGLMLFRAVIDRLLGTSDAHFDDDAEIQKRISTEAYPHLLDVVLSLLKAPADGTTTRFEGVFPALQLLQLTRVPEDRLSETTSAVETLISSSSWHVRDKAARTLASFTSMDELALQLDELLSGGPLRENHTHGLLLLIKYTLAQATTDIIQPETPKHELTIAFYDCSCLARSVGELFHRTRSVVTKAASLDVVRACSAFLTGINTVTRASYDHGALLLTLAKPDSASGHAIDVFQAILDDIREDPTAAVIRQAWARLVAQYLSAQPVSEHDSWSDLIAMVVELSQYDEDAVAHFLQALHPVALDSGKSTSQLAMQLYTYISGGNARMELKCTAQRTLIEHAGAPENSVEFDIVRIQKYSADSGSTARYADQLLQIQALQIEFLLRTLPVVHNELIEDVSTWSAACVASIDGTGVYAREAAAEALGRVTQLWRIMQTEERLESHFLRLCLAVYDLLNDDDEDTRLLASKISTRIIPGTPPRSPGLEPIIASQKLLAFCIKRWPSSTHLIAEAFYRAFSFHETTANNRDNNRDSPQTITERLATTNGINDRDTTLFAEEKQNLYIDEAKEVRIWSQVLTKLHATSIPKSLIQSLTTYVSSALSDLTVHAQNLPQNFDGPLGWTTTILDLYTLGLRVIYGAEVLLNISGDFHGVKIPVQPSDLRKRLFEFVTALEKIEGNCLWKWEAERVLTESLSRKVERVGGFIGRGLEEHI